MARPARALRHAWGFALLCLLAWSGMGRVPVWAGAQVGCPSPMVFEGAAVNTGILEFSYAGRPDDPLSETARQLSLLIQLDALLSQVKYGSIGVVHLLVPPGLREDCAPERMIARMLGHESGSDGVVQPGHGLILVWGHLFESEDSIYLQTSLRFLRRDRTETIVRNLPLDEGEALRLRGQLPAQTINFAPRRLGRADLDAIASAFAAAAVVRPQPDLSLAGAPIGPDDLSSFAYVVREVRGDWMRIESRIGGPSGWINANLGETAGELRQRLPELSFLDAVAGYLRSRIAAEAQEISDAPLDFVAAARERFATAASPSAEPVAHATLAAMLGMMEVLARGSPDAPLSEHAAMLFAEPAALMPYSAAARTLKTLAALRSDPTSPEDVLAEARKAVSVDPSSDLALANLENLYRAQAAMEDGVRSPAAPEAEWRADQIRQVRAYLAARERTGAE